MKGKITEAGENLLDKMMAAYRDLNWPKAENRTALEAALRVAAEEMPPERRNALFAPLSPEDRVTIQLNDRGLHEVHIDGDDLASFTEKQNAEAFRLGLIQQIKEGKR